jgi:hypothetical protein
LHDLLAFPTPAPRAGLVDTVAPLARYDLETEEKLRLLLRDREHSVRVAAIRATAPAGAAATSAAAADDLRAELELIEPARTALARGDDRGARPWLERHAREHTAGVLQIERDGWLVVLDCRAGRSDAADRGRRFVLAHPRNGLRDDIITACALDREFGTDRATDSTPATE